MTEGAWGQKRVPGCWRRAQSACAAVSCARWGRKVVEVWKEVMVEAGRASVRDRWERARLLAAGGEAGGRRGCQTRENERFSCSFFLQGEETSNRRLNERAGHLDMVGAAVRTLDSAMRWDCGRRQKLHGRCCLECCCRDRRDQADVGSFHSFGEFADISRLLWLQGAGAAPAVWRAGMNNGIFSHSDIL